MHSSLRRAVALNVFQSSHIAPSHRRFPHVLWMDSIGLIADLLMGCGVGRYLGCLEGPHFEQEVALHGFSAGIFSRLCLLQILWTFPGVTTNSRLGAIACPPGLLMMAPSMDDDELHLIHYESDELCCWRPGRKLLKSCCTKYTYIMNENSSYKGHFGSSDLLLVPREMPPHYD